MPKKRSKSCSNCGHFNTGRAKFCEKCENILPQIRRKRCEIILHSKIIRLEKWLNNPVKLLK